MKEHVTGVSMHDIFGDSSGAQPATPGSYGEAPRGDYRLPAGTRLGPVHLQIADLDRSLAYYQDTIGMRLLHQDGVSAVLGAQDERPLVALHEYRGVRPAPHRGRTGLFHFAILLPDRASLGRFVRHLGETDQRVGSADHLVSESLYLQDPDNLGIEVYADRPRGAWRRIGRELMMATDPLDVAGLLSDAGSERWTGMPAGTVMGHVHLHVGDLKTGSTFFSDALGFDRTVWEYPGALFLAADGYHHHLGTNTWAGPDAAPPLADEAHLLEWTIELPSVGELDAVARSLVRGGHSAEPDIGALVTHDPWGTLIRLKSAAPPR
jgi:catechol 2,3-dioxygenase